MNLHDEIDELAVQIERAIRENKAHLDEFQIAEVDESAPAEDVDTEELFS